MSDPITPRQAAMILMKASGIDNRDPSAAADELWAAALTEAGVSFDDCMAAVVTHYTRSTDRLMPNHVIAIAQARAAARRQADRDRAAIEAGDPRPGALNPGYVQARIRQAVAAAELRRAAREAAADGPAGPDAPPGRVETLSGEISGPVPGPVPEPVGVRCAVPGSAGWCMSDTMCDRVCARDGDR